MFTRDDIYKRYNRSCKCDSPRNGGHIDTSMDDRCLTCGKDIEDISHMINAELYKINDLVNGVDKQINEAYNRLAAIYIDDKKHIDPILKKESKDLVKLKHLKSNIEDALRSLNDLEKIVGGINEK